MFIPSDMLLFTWQAFCAWDRERVPGAHAQSLFVSPNGTCKRPYTATHTIVLKFIVPFGLLPDVLPSLLITYLCLDPEILPVCRQVLRALPGGGDRPDGPPQDEGGQEVPQEGGHLGQ